jgi:hypothetical protein
MSKKIVLFSSEEKRIRKIFLPFRTNLRTHVNRT